ncbi:MAG: hypothetical protein LW710_14635 [Burkholderiales bacterium]|jgi:hypothetical protein|uniref:hypothetical protein n=1 Tax=Limnobacter sp. TaxID=2003368 RepID=UPI0039451A42|nr:hypothetical protein [Burkholderiales bacterium]
MQRIPNAGAPQPAPAQRRLNPAANAFQGAQADIYRGLSSAAQFVAHAPAPVISNVISYFKKRGSEHFGVIASWSRECKEISDSRVTELDVPHQGIPRLVTKILAGDYQSLETLILHEHTSNSELQQIMNAVQEKGLNITELDLASCEFITRLPANLPPGLLKLDVSNCQQLRELPANLPTGLKELDASECYRITAIPFLPNSLERLSFDFCTRITAFTEPLPENLRILNLRECNRLLGFPPHLPSTLEELDLFGCINLQELPDPLPSSLRLLNVRRCDSLEELPQMRPRDLRIIE